MIRGAVGELILEFESAPRGQQGTTCVTVQGKKYDVRWNLDRAGIWLELANGVSGFDFTLDTSEEGRSQFFAQKRGTSERWNHLHFVRAGEREVSASQGTHKKTTKIKSQMPGKIVRILVKPDAVVTKDQPLLVMEAMKMENEIKAPLAGKVSKISVI